jgi:hypothetical protein
MFLQLNYCHLHVIIFLSTRRFILILSRREDVWDRRGDLMNTSEVTVVQYVKVSSFILIIVTNKK